MLQRIMKLPADERSGDFSRLKVVAASGSELPGDLATDWMDAFGDNLYNTYGSTEVAWATIAQPARHARGAGHGREAAVRHRRTGSTTRRASQVAARASRAGSSSATRCSSSGYTGGGDKDAIDGLMSTGDVGRFDEEGRLFVEGRDDEMIVSGGENVFPRRSRTCLARHGGAGRRGRRGRRRRLRQAPAGLRGARRRRSTRTTLKEHVKENLARYKVPARDRLPRRAAAQRDRQGAQEGPQEVRRRRQAG